MSTRFKAFEDPKSLFSSKCQKAIKKLISRQKCVGCLSWEGCSFLFQEMHALTLVLNLIFTLVSLHGDDPWLHSRKKVGT